MSEMISVETSIIIDIQDNDVINNLLLEELYKQDRDDTPVYNLYKKLVGKDLPNGTKPHNNTIYEMILDEYQYEIPTNIECKMTFNITRDEIDKL